MYQIVLMMDVVIALALIGLILIQQGKGADIGASFGSGASNTIFGSQGIGSFLFKATSGLAILFFMTSLTLSYLVTQEYQRTKLQLDPQQTSSQGRGLPLPVEDGS